MPLISWVLKILSLKCARTVEQYNFSTIVFSFYDLLELTQREIFKYIVLELRTFVLENRVGTNVLNIRTK